MGSYNCSDELVHYGVKGMKWGVRKTRKQPSANTRISSADDSRKRFRNEAKKDATYVLAKHREFNKAPNAAYQKYLKSRSEKDWGEYMTAMEQADRAFAKFCKPYQGKYDKMYIGGGSDNGKHYTTLQLIKYDENGRPQTYLSPRVYD